MNNMRKLWTLFPALCCAVTALAADDLDRLRDRQDRPGLEARATALQAAAEKNPERPGWMVSRGDRLFVCRGSRHGTAR